MERFLYFHDYLKYLFIDTVVFDYSVKEPMALDIPVFILEIGSGTIKLLAGYELNARPVILHVMQSEYHRVLMQDKIVDPNKTTQLIKKLIRDMEIHLGKKCESLHVILPPNHLEVFHGEKRTNTVDPNGIIHPMDIHNLHSMFQKEFVGTNVAQVCIVPMSYQIDGDKYSINPPIGEQTSNIVLQAYVQYILSSFFQGILQVMEAVGIKVKRYILDSQGIADIIETQYKDFVATYVLIDHGANQTNLNLVSQHKLIRSETLETGSEQLTAIIANRFGIALNDARLLKEKFGYETRQQIFDGIIYQQNGILIRQSNFNQVIKEFYDQLIEEMMIVLQEYRVDKETMDLTDMKFVLVGGGAALPGITTLLKSLGQGQGVEKPYIRTIGARHTQTLSLLGGLRFSYRYTLVEDDVRIFTRIERQPPSAKRRFVNYDEE
jgi:cell division ATPase FtsA